jgi:hypothetical protein
MANRVCIIRRLAAAGFLVILAAAVPVCAQSNAQKQVVKKYVESDKVKQRLRDGVHSGVPSAFKPFVSVGATKLSFKDLSRVTRPINGHDIPGLLIHTSGQVWVDPPIGENDVFFDLDIFVALVDGKPLVTVNVSITKRDHEGPGPNITSDIADGLKGSEKNIERAVAEELAKQLE